MKLFASIMTVVAEGVAKQALFIIVLIGGFLTYATCAGLAEALSARGAMPGQCPVTAMYSRSD